MTRPFSSSFDTQGAGKANADYAEPQDKLSHLPNYYRWTYGYLRPYLRGEVAELGCGAGHGISQYLDHVDQVTAVDHDPLLLQRLAGRFGSDRVTPLLLDLKEDWSALPSRAFDAIVMMDILEHFEDDAQLVQKAKRCLSRKGVIAIKVPAHAKWFCDMDAASGHFRRYDRGEVEQLARTCGLRVLKLQRINVSGALIYNLKRRRQKRTNFSRTFSDRQLRVGNLAIPVLALADWIPLLPGLSWVAILGRG